MGVKGDKWRGGWSNQYADNFDKIFKKGKEKMKDELTKEQQKELEKIVEDVVEEAKNVVEDYTKNPSEMSGSITQVHESSPYVATREERLYDFNWKKIVQKPSTLSSTSKKKKSE